MTTRTKVELEDIAAQDRELTPEEQEAVTGGLVSLPHGTRPGAGDLRSDPCMGGEIAAH